jgi:hypothetical protein
VRFKIYDAGYESSVAALRDAMGEKDFESAWAEGCRFPIRVADGDVSIRAFAEFSSKWRTRFSHLRGGS